VRRFSGETEPPINKSTVETIGPFGRLGANGIRTSSIPCGANRKRIGTAKLGNRDKPDQRPAIGPELAVSGPDSAVPLSQDPAKARRFLGCSLVAGAKSLQPQTTWRSGESSANPSLGAESLLNRENTGNSVVSGPIETRRGPEDDRFPASFGGISLEATGYVSSTLDSVTLLLHTQVRAPGALARPAHGRLLQPPGGQNGPRDVTRDA
jgi:hypothetical protein